MITIFKKIKKYYLKRIWKGHQLYKNVQYEFEGIPIDDIAPTDYYWNPESDQFWESMWSFGGEFYNLLSASKAKILQMKMQQGKLFTHPLKY